jgi:hypothetical protein
MGMSNTIFDTPVSVFRNAHSTQPATALLKQFLFGQKHRPAVDAVRAAQDKAKRNELKKHLPAATISGTFAVRKIEGLERYNGLVALDFDAADNPGTTPDEMKERLAMFQEVAYAGLSASGAGVWAIVPTNNTDWTEHGFVVQTLIKVMEKYDLYADKACKDVCRLRYFSYDTAPHIRDDVRLFDAQRLIDYRRQKEAQQPADDPFKRPRPIITREKAASKSDNERTYEQVEACISKAEQRGIDLTANYDDWVRMGMAIASEFGSTGEELFHRISCRHPKYSHTETEKKYLDFCRNGQRVKIGSFFHICSQHGITIK